MSEQIPREEIRSRCMAILDENKKCGKHPATITELASYLGFSRFSIHKAFNGNYGNYGKNWEFNKVYNYLSNFIKENEKRANFGLKIEDFGEYED